MMGKQLSIPKILTVSQVARMSAQILLQMRPRFLIESGWAARTVLFAQAAEAVIFETMHPALDGGRVFSKQLRHFVATLTLANEQNSVQSVIITRLVRAV